MIAPRDGYPRARELYWVQEEPRNYGAWTYVRGAITDLLAARKQPLSLTYVGRAASASPATGSPDSHAYERKLILEEAFANPSAAKSAANA